MDAHPPDPPPAGDQLSPAASSDRSSRSSPQATYTRAHAAAGSSRDGPDNIQITIPLLPYLPAYVRQVDPVFQELVVPSAAVISWMASASAGLTLCPSSLCASATLLARARTKRR